MTLYAELTIVRKDGSHETINVTEDDTVEANEGGFELRFGSSPATSTFIPYHRIWLYEEINTALLPHAVNDDGSIDKDSTPL